jgi:glutaryl-CoA dehydrogenase
LLLEAELSDDERQVRDQVRTYAQSKLLPRVTQGYRDETFDKSIMTEMGDLGLLGATIEGFFCFCLCCARVIINCKRTISLFFSIGYGCAGVNYVTYGLIAREIERCDNFL